MSTYSKRDLRAADMLAILLLGLGAIVTASAVLQAAGVVDAWSKAGSTAGGWAAGPLPWAYGGGLLLLGGALGLKVRQLVRNRGREPVDYDGVPD